MGKHTGKRDKKGREKLLQIYGGKIRVRICGVLKSNDKVLLVNHKFLNDENVFWNFPGGGLEDSETIEECLRREFLEEVNATIEVGEFLYLNQHISDPLHAIELYFRVRAKDSHSCLGADPEFNILSGLKWFTKEELLRLPKHQLPDFSVSLVD